MSITPFHGQKLTETQDQIRKMFDDISHRYDLLNGLLSFGIDKRWRRRAIATLYNNNSKPKHILDVATGTGDLATQALQLNPERIIGVDISEGMLAVGRGKIKLVKGGHKIELCYADSQNLPFDDNHFDAVTVGFGVRNFADLHQGLSEIKRVLKPGGMLVVLEFSRPRKFPFKQLYSFYLTRALPVVGKWISGHSRAYQYLPKTVQLFPDNSDFVAILHQIGYVKCLWKPLTFGIVSLYTGIK